MKLLIVRDDARGDVLLTTPAVRALKEKNPDAEIHYLAKREASQVLVGNPHITQLHIMEDCGGLRSVQFDVAYDLRDAPGPCPWNAKETIRAINNPIMRSDIPSRKARHASGKTFAQLYADVCGVDVTGLQNVITIPRQVIKEADQLLQNLGLLDREYIVCAFDSCWQTKYLPRIIINEITERLSDLCPVVMVGTNGSIRGKSRGGKYYNLVGKTTIPQVARIIQKSSMFVGIDSLPLHLADTFGVPSVSIWTATRPDTILTSGRCDNAVFNKKTCAPCFSQRCSNGRSCLPSVSEIINTAVKVWGKTHAQPKVWIVMPALDQVHLTLQAVDSIDRLTAGVEYEIVLVDDGGSRASQNCYNAINRYYKNVQVVRLDRTSGFVSATNAGIKKALEQASPHDYILWLNNDVVVDNGQWLKRLLDTADENCIVGPVGSRLDDTFRHAGYVTTPGADVHYIDGWCLMAHVSAYEATAVGMLDSNIKSFSEDADWCIRAARAGYSLKMVGEVGIRHLHHQTFKSMGLKDAHIPSLHYMREKWGTLESALQPQEVTTNG